MLKYIRSHAVLSTKIKHSKFNLMRIITVNVPGKGSPSTKIIEHEDLSHETCTGLCLS